MRLKVNHAKIADVLLDEEADKRVVILQMDEESFFETLDSVNPSNIVKYLYMRGITPKDLKYNIQKYGRAKENQIQDNKELDYSSTGV